MTLLHCLVTHALLAAATAPATGDHFIHGTLTTTGGETVTDFVRQEGGDVCWDHLFAARRVRSPWQDLVDLEALAAERRARYFAEHGLLDRLAYVLGGNDEGEPGGRWFICRYRDLAVLERDPGDDEVVVATLRDGSVHRLRAEWRDLGNDLVTGGGDRTREFDADDVARLALAPAPPGADPGVARIWAELTTADGDFAGWLRWDRDECLTTDVLDGEEEGGRDHEIAFGDIAAIERVNSRSCRVELRDGRVLVLRGSNDVNDDNRGIVIETAAYGRAVADWKTFRRIDFVEPPADVAPVAAHTGATELRGEVATRDGARHAGRLVLDLDEGWAWEILDGHHGGIEYEVPLGAVARIDRDAEGVSRVHIRGGEVLTMSTGQDVGAKNRGVLVLGAGRPVQIPWSDVASVAFR